MHRTLYTLALLTLVVGAALVGGLVIAAHAGNTVALDENTGLTDESSIETFTDDGAVTTTVTSPHLDIAVAESSRDIGVEGIQYTDFDAVYLQVSHHEDMVRTIRFYVPAEYWHPHPDQLTSVEGDLTATLTPIKDSEYTAVEIHFEGEQTGTFKVQKQAALVFSVRDYGSSWLEENAGIDVPDVGSGDDWEYVPVDELTGDEPVFGIDTEGEDITLQYDRANTADPADQVWRTVPSCSSSTGGTTPVCTFTKQNNPDVVFVLAQTDDPPDVRYQVDGGWLSDLRSSLEEATVDIWRDAYEDAKEFLKTLFS